MVLMNGRHDRKEYVPQVDRTEELPPPALVVVMGPKGCGKSTLIRSLVKYYTGQNLSDVLGPITVSEAIAFFAVRLVGWLDNRRDGIIIYIYEWLVGISGGGREEKASNIL